MRARTRHAADRVDHDGVGACMTPIAFGIGGLITSTFLSLLVIPVVFTYVDDFIAWTRRRFRRGQPAPAAAEIR